MCIYHMCDMGPSSGSGEWIPYEVLGKGMTELKGRGSWGVFYEVNLERVVE